MVPPPVTATPPATVPPPLSLGLNDSGIGLLVGELIKYLIRTFMKIFINLFSRSKMLCND